MTIIDSVFDKACESIYKCTQIDFIYKNAIKAKLKEGEKVYQVKTPTAMWENCSEFDYHHYKDDDYYQVRIIENKGNRNEQ
mgnify:CR=1 FL=1